MWNNRRTLHVRTDLSANEGVLMRWVKMLDETVDLADVWR
jgi:alpha-ketoglutarate-dependent taurine dioxygenase